jgi:hypothetical protein
VPGDPSLLALVLDDPIAPRVLAWWSATKAGSRCTDGWRLGANDLRELLRVAETSGPQLEATLERCRLAGLFDAKDGGISETASKWLRAIVAERLGLAPTSKKKAAKKAPKSP